MMASMASMATRAWSRRRGRGEVWLPRMIRLPAIETSSYETADDLDDAPPKACESMKTCNRMMYTENNVRVERLVINILPPVRPMRS